MGRALGARQILREIPAEFGQNYALDSLLIINPRARLALRIDKSVLAAPWAALGRVKVAVSDSGAQARELAGEAAAAGAKVVAIVGGDGSANGVAAALLGSQCALAVICGGTTNVLARSIGTPRDPVAASIILAAGWAAGHSRYVSVGRANEAIFLANVGVGLDAAIVERVEASPKRKRRFGHAWFLAAALLESGGAKYPALSVTGTTTAGKRWGPHATSLVVGLRSGPYSFVGPRPIQLSPGAGLRRDLHGVWLARTGRLALAHAGLAALRRSGPRSEVLTRVESTETIEVRSAAPAAFQVDGEFVGRSRIVRIDLHPQPLRLIWPG